MRSNHALSAFILLGILVMSNIGCIGLVPAREFIEANRGEPTLDISDRVYTVSQTYDTVSATPYLYEERFEVDPQVSKISVFMSASLDACDGLTIPEIPVLEDACENFQYVEARLLDPNNEEIWTHTLYKTDSAMEVRFEENLAHGTWIMKVEARAYGEDLMGLYKDSFEVVISVEKQCWEYQNDEIVCD